MAKIRKRVSRKKGIERPGELLSLYERGIEYIHKNRRPFLFISVILSVLILTSAGIFSMNFYYNKKALALEYEATRYYDVDKPYTGSQISPEERYKKALDLYKEVVSEYPRTKIAPFALYSAGNCYLQLKNIEEAEKTYRTLIEKYPNNKFILPLVYQKLGYIHKSKGNTAEALRNFEKTASLDTEIKDLAYIEIGRIYETEGKTEEAVRNYQKVVDNFPSSPWYSEAKRKLENLKK